jgi:hypothetical protein
MGNDGGGALTTRRVPALRMTGVSPRMPWVSKNSGLLSALLHSWRTTVDAPRDLYRKTNVTYVLGLVAPDLSSRWGFTPQVAGYWLYVGVSGPNLIFAMRLVLEDDTFPTYPMQISPGRRFPTTASGIIWTVLGALLTVRSILLIRKTIAPKSFAEAFLKFLFEFAECTVISRPGKLKVILTCLLYHGEHERAFCRISGSDAFSVCHATSKKKSARNYISIQSNESASVELGPIICPAYGEGLLSWASAQGLPQTCTHFSCLSLNPTRHSMSILVYGDQIFWQRIVARDDVGGKSTVCEHGGMLFLPISERRALRDNPQVWLGPPVFRSISFVLQMPPNFRMWFKIYVL